MDLFACRQMGGVEAIGSDPRDENEDHCKNKVVVFNHRVVTLVPVSWKTVDMKGLLW